VCAQTAIFSAKPVRQKMRELYILYVGRFGVSQAWIKGCAAFGGFFHP